MKEVFLLCTLLLGGCVPDELASAARQFARENYPATIRELDRYLSASRDGGALGEGPVREPRYEAAAYFYRGLSKRACLVEQAAGVPVDFCESGRFRHGPPQDVSFTPQGILKDYLRSADLAPDLVKIIDFHVGMELLFDGRHGEALMRFRRFVERMDSSDRRLLASQFGDEAGLARCDTFARKFVSAMASEDGLARAMALTTEAERLYRDILFRKSAGHELHNMDLLMRRYAVRRFAFLRRYFKPETGYDYLAKTMECGMDFLILRQGISKEAVGFCLRREGFGGWKCLPSSEGVALDCRMGIRVFKGAEGVPVSVCSKKADFDYVLVVVFSERKGVLYCAVLDHEGWARLSEAIDRQVVRARQNLPDRRDEAPKEAA